MDHLLLHCRLTMRLLWEMFRWLGAPWLTPKTANDLLFNWKSGRRRRQRSWNVFPLALIWVVGCLEREIRELLKE